MFISFCKAVKLFWNFKERHFLYEFFNSFLSSNVTERKELGVCQFSKNCGEKFNFLYKRIFNIPLSFFFFPLNVNFQRNPREVLKNIGEQLGIFRCIGTFLWEGIAIDGGGTRSNCERGSRISRNWIEVKTTLQFVQA